MLKADAHVHTLARTDNLCTKRGDRMTSSRPELPRPPLRLASASPQVQSPSATPDAVTRQAGVSGSGPGASGLDLRIPEVQLRVLATSDIHANILSYDYSSNRPLFGQGLAQTASLIAAARATHPDSLLVDNGDFLQGSALADLAALPRRRRGHPVIAAMNALRYDVASLGNHEFNFGLGVLRLALSQARFPFVSANVLLRRGEVALDDDTLVPPFVILTRHLADQFGQHHKVRVGFIGLTPPEILQWDREHLFGRIDTRTMAEAARAWAPYVRRLGADILICLAHTGIAEQSGLPESEGRLSDLAQIAEIDAIVAGHSHMVFPHRGGSSNPAIQPQDGTVLGKPVVQPGYNGSHLGLLDLTLRKDGDRWFPFRCNVRADSVSETVAGLPSSEIRKHSAPLRRAVQADHRATLDWTRRQLGHSDLAMSTCFSVVADSAAMRLLAAAKIAHVRKALQGTADAETPVLALTTPYRSGGRGGPLNYSEVLAGPVTLRHLFDLYPYPNALVAYRTTGAEVLSILERSASQFLQLRAGGGDMMLIDPGFPSFSFAMVAGLSYRIDLSQPARHDTQGAIVRPSCGRIRDLRLNGAPLGPDDRVILASNSFRINESLVTTSNEMGDIVVSAKMRCTEVMRQFIAEAGTVTKALLQLDRPAGWGFVPMPDTSVVFDTGAMAERYLAEVSHLRPEFVGLTAGGFRRYRLHLGMASGAENEAATVSFPGLAG